MGGPSFEDDELPQEVRDQIAQMEAQDAAAAAASNNGQGPAVDVDMGGAAGGGEIKICTHCTFENAQGARDCEVCGLPL